MKLAHKIRLYPNKRQTTMLNKHCGIARLAYNQCLGKWNEDYENGVKNNFFSIKNKSTHKLYLPKLVKNMKKYQGLNRYLEGLIQRVTKKIQIIRAT